jgi:hypothetical protein
MHAGLRIKCSTLTKTRTCQLIFVKLPHITFHETSLNMAKLKSSFGQLLVWNAQVRGPNRKRFLKQLKAASSKKVTTVTCISYFLQSIRNVFPSRKRNFSCCPCSSPWNAHIFFFQTLFWRLLRHKILRHHSMPRWVISRWAHSSSIRYKYSLHMIHWRSWLIGWHSSFIFETSKLQFSALRLDLMTSKLFY